MEFCVVAPGEEIPDVPDIDAADVAGDVAGEEGIPG